MVLKTCLWTDFIELRFFCLAKTFFFTESFVFHGIFCTFVFVFRKDMEEQFDIRDYRPSGKERDFENALRPLQFEDFSGQDKVVDNLRIFVKAGCCTDLPDWERLH